MLLKGKRCLVTGGSSGIGRATAARFTEEGADVHIVGHRADDVDRTVAELGVTGSVCDIRNADAVEKMVEQPGDIDIAVANAGVYAAVDVLNDPIEKWHDQMNTNLWGTIHTARAVGRQMVRRKGGRIVLVSSIMDRLTDPGSGPYALTKAAISQLGRQLAVEWAGHGVYVNVVAPGCVQTPMSYFAGVNEYESDWFKTYFVSPERPRIPITRPGLPEEIAEAILFMANPRNTYCTGQVLTIDGGLTIKY